MKRLGRVLEILAWTAFFVFAAFVLALRFWLLPGIERYRDDIVSSLSRSIGRPVKVGGIEAGWLGLRPQISFSDVRILDADGREALVLPAVYNILSWRTLLSGELRLHSLVIESPRLTVRRDAAGVLHVAGIALAEGGGSAGVLGWALEQEEVVVRHAEIEWLDEKRGAPPLALSQLDLRLHKAPGQHQVGLSARPPAQLGTTLELRAELSGRSAGDPSSWSGRLFAEVGYTDLAGWRPWIDYPVDVQSGQGAVRLWTTLEDGRLTQGTADVELAGVSARLDKDLPPLELSRLSGRLQLQSRAGAYALSGRKVALVSARGAAPEPTDFALEWKPAGAQPEHGAFTAKVIELEPLSQLAEALVLPGDARRVLAELAPRGRLSELRFDWSGSLAEPVRLSAKANFSDLAVNARERIPGFSGLSGLVEATESKGSVRLASRKVTIDLPAVMAEPRLSLERLEGQVDWERTEGRALNVRLQSLGFANEHAEGTAAGTYSYAGDGPGTIDLEASLQRADGSQVARYLPAVSILGAGTHDWLAHSILGGQSSDARLKLKGDLRDFPFTDPAKGQFQVVARVEKGVLEYASGWPRIEDIDAELLFEADRMQIVARSAAILGTRVADVRVSIPSFFAPSVHLLVNGQAEGPTGEFLKFIEASPVRGMIGGGTDGLAATGRGKLRLGLDLPLRELPKAKVSGEFDFAAANVVLPYGGLPPVERAAGKLTFSESSFALRELKGRVFGGAVTVSGGSRGPGGIDIVAKGEADVAALDAVFDHPWRRHLSGSAAYTATVFVRSGRVRVIVESPLRGVSSALPPPFTKVADDTLPLRVEVRPTDAGGRDRISVTLGKLASGVLLRQRSGDAMAIQRASIALRPAGGPVRLPPQPGLLVYGTLDSFDADAWLPFLTEQPGGAPGPGAAPSQAPARVPLNLDLKAGTLDVYGKRIHDIALRASADAGGWSATVDAEEIAGDVSYRNELGGKLVARLTRLHVPKDYFGAKAQEPGSTRELPAIDLIAERFAFKDKELGRIELAAKREGDDWQIDKVVLASAEAKVTGNGSWRPGSPALTSLSLNLDSSDAGRFLGRLGYPDLVKGGKARMQASLTWAGDPAAIDYPSLAGEVQLQAADGQFSEVDPGLGKLISLMSLQALPKRLSLDFRDVFSKGFQFDEIASAARVERGVMTLKDFKMSGSAAEVEMAGQVDLAKETQDLSVRVLPSLGDSASTVLAFVNPLLVFPAAIAQKILKDPLGHIFAFNYSVTGSWADPKVAKRGIEAHEVEHPPGPRPGPNN